MPRAIGKGALGCEKATMADVILTARSFCCYISGVFEPQAQTISRKHDSNNPVTLMRSWKAGVVHSASLKGGQLRRTCLRVEDVDGPSGAPSEDTCPIRSDR